MVSHASENGGTKLGPAEAGESWPPLRARCLKVAFIGTHGVGKTTLCFELAARLKWMDYRVDMVKEVARMSSPAEQGHDG
jgi:signal recognition particle GTPase